MEGISQIVIAKPPTPVHILAHLSKQNSYFFMGRRLVRRVEYLNSNASETTRRPADSLDRKPIQMGNELRSDCNLLNMCCLLNEPSTSSNCKRPFLASIAAI
jgi:hypothetical protein